MNIFIQDISSIMQDTVVTVDMQDPVHKVEQLMEQHDVTSVPVTDANRKDCFGIISLKDIQHFHATGKSAWTVRAWEMCTYKPLVVSAEITVDEAANLMITHGIHHLVVAGHHKKVIGFLSSLDVLRAIMTVHAAENNSESADEKTLTIIPKT